MTQSKSMHYEHLGDKISVLVGAIVALMKYLYDHIMFLNIHLQPDFWSTLTQACIMAAFGGAAGWIGKQIGVTCWKYLSVYITSYKKRRKK